MIQLRINSAMFRVGLMTALCMSSTFLSANEPEEPIQLKIEQASAGGRSKKEVLIKCSVLLSNTTGNMIFVKSPFHSAFDGLHLVVLNKSGKRLVQQPYTLHQSPSNFKPRDFSLKKGGNRWTMTFPVDTRLLKGNKVVRVLLVGNLPGNNYPSVLCSNMVTVKVKRRITIQSRSDVLNVSFKSLAEFLEKSQSSK